MRPEPDEASEEAALLAALAELPTLAPHPTLAARFHARAAREHRRGLQRSWLALAAAAMLALALGSGWAIDHHHKLAALAELRGELSQTMQSLSAATRIQGVTVASDVGRQDDSVVKALTTALLTDSNTNVRVSAAEALGRIATPEAFERAAARSMRTDSSPFVQAALIQGAAALPLAAQRRLFSQLLENPRLDSTLRASVASRSAL